MRMESHSGMYSDRHLGVSRDCKYSILVIVSLNGRCVNVVVSFGSRTLPTGPGGPAGLQLYKKNPFTFPYQHINSRRAEDPKTSQYISVKAALSWENWGRICLDSKTE